MIWHRPPPVIITTAGFGAPGGRLLLSTLQHFPGLNPGALDSFFAQAKILPISDPSEPFILPTSGVSETPCAICTGLETHLLTESHRM